MTIHPFCHNISGNMEKNWGPFYVDGELHFVYNVDPFVVARVDRGFECPSPISTNIECHKLSRVPTARNLTKVFDKHGLTMRGGTPGLCLQKTSTFSSVTRCKSRGMITAFRILRCREQCGRATNPIMPRCTNSSTRLFFSRLEKKTVRGESQDSRVVPTSRGRGRISPRYISRRDWQRRILVASSRTPSSFLLESRTCTELSVQ